MERNLTEENLRDTYGQVYFDLYRTSNPATTRSEVIRRDIDILQYLARNPSEINRTNVSDVIWDHMETFNSKEEAIRFFDQLSEEDYKYIIPETIPEISPREISKGGFTSGVAILNIASNLDFIDLLNYSQTNRRIRNVLNTSNFWDMKLEQLNIKSDTDFQKLLGITNVKRTVLTVMGIKEMGSGNRPEHIKRSFTSTETSYSGYVNMEVLSHLLPFLVNLRALTFIDVVIEEFPVELSYGLSNLQTLEFIRSVRGKGLPLGGPFKNFKKLKRLAFRHNVLGKLPGDLFSGLAELKVLDLNSNKITYLPAEIFEPLKNLLILDFGVNLLRNIPPGLFDHNTKLEDLDVSNNKIRKLPPGLFDNIDQLSDLDISGNKLPESEIRRLENKKNILSLRW